MEVEPHTQNEAVVETGSLIWKSNVSVYKRNLTGFRVGYENCLVVCTWKQRLINM